MVMVFENLALILSYLTKNIFSANFQEKKSNKSSGQTERFVLQ